jgi:hypothetical protein
MPAFEKKIDSIRKIKKYNKAFGVRCGVINGLIEIR